MLCVSVYVYMCHVAHVAWRAASDVSHRGNGLVASTESVTLQVKIIKRY